MTERTQSPQIQDAVNFKVVLPPCRNILLDNGVPVYYLNDGAEDVTRIEWIFKAGNSFETKKAVAESANYLLKNGTSGKSAFEITQHFEFYGAHLSSSCHHEYASLTLNCLSKHVHELLPLVREMITDAIYPEKEIDIYKRNGIQRLEVNLKKCEFVAHREIDACLYGYDHPYGRFPNKEDILSLTRQELQEFFRKYYQQTDCTIFAAGKLPKDFEQQMNNQFGDLKLHEGREITYFDRTAAQQRIYRIHNEPNAVQGAIRMARVFPGRLHPDFKKVSVLNTIFGGYFGSRLMANIREEKGYTYGIYSYLHNHTDISALIISTEAGKNVSEQTIAEVYHEMEILRKELVGQQELSLVKNYIMGHQLAYLDGPFQIINRWKGLILNDLEEDYFYDTLQVIRNVTPLELQEMANKYFQKEDFYELVVF